MSLRQPLRFVLKAQVCLKILGQQPYYKQEQERKIKG